MTFAAGAVVGVSMFKDYQDKQCVREQARSRPAPLDHSDTAEKNAYTQQQQQLTPRAKAILKYGPDATQIENMKILSNYVSSLNYKTKTPNWVLEHYNEASNMSGKGDRSGVDFFADDKLPELFRANNQDYFKSGYSRGHCAAASNHKITQEAMRDTFNLSANIVPQDYKHNAFYWHRLEIYARDLAKQFEDVYVATGPLWLPQVEAAATPTAAAGEVANNNNNNNGNNKSVADKRFVKYRVIGHNDVAVPTHMFKVIYAKSSKTGDGTAANGLAAFVIPNEEIPENKPLTDFQVPIDVVEKYGGFQMFTKVDKKQTPNLCSVVSCELMSAREHRYMFLSRDLKTSRALWFLDKTWKQLNDENFTITDDMRKTYEEKRKELLAAQQEAKKQQQQGNNTKS